MFCSEVTFGINHKHAVPFEVKYTPEHSSDSCSKLTGYLLCLAAGDDRLIAERMAMNAARNGFQTCAGLPGAGLTVQRQHRHRDRRGYLMWGVSEGDAGTFQQQTVILLSVGHVQLWMFCFNVSFKDVAFRRRAFQA